MNDEAVCAVVVTYNRKELLIESLDALRMQTRSVDRVLIVDNASTDGTRELLEAHGYFRDVSVEYLPLTRNIGGAGGFHEGVKRAAATGATWIWLLDDDTIARPDALAQLFEARASFPEHQHPDLLASKVLWTDGTMHPMNVPRIRRTEQIENVVSAAEHGTVALRATSFVSLLLHRRHVEQFGLPIADYFIWNDDVEYTARILRTEIGVLAPKSVVVHKTAKRSGPAGARYYYAVRNQLWMLTRSNAWSTDEKVRLAAGLLLQITSYLRQEGFALANIKVVVRALIDGLTHRPREADSSLAAARARSV